MMEKKRNPWAWIPTLYFAEGLPNVVVMTVAVVMYMEMGMTDTEIALYTSWLGLPWVIKPLWSPFVDLFKTKRWWVLTMQLLLGAAFAGVAFTVKTDFWFQGTMFFFFLMAFSSATHDIAADGFYMLDLDSHDQSWFVGIRNTFYRIAVIFGQGVLVWLAGVLQEIFPDSKAFTWSLIFFGLSAIFIAIWLYHRFAMPRPEERRAHGKRCGTRTVADAHLVLHEGARQANSLRIALLAALSLPRSHAHQNGQHVLAAADGGGGTGPHQGGFRIGLRHGRTHRTALGRLYGR